MSRNHGRSKKIAQEFDLSCISGKMVFFPGKYDVLIVTANLIIYTIKIIIKKLNS